VKVSWDDEFPNIIMESHKISWFQTTNQIDIHSYWPNEMSGPSGSTGIFGWIPTQGISPLNNGLCGSVPAKFKNQNHEAREKITTGYEL